MTQQRENVGTIERRILAGYGFADVTTRDEASDVLFGVADADGKRPGNIVNKTDTQRIAALERELDEAKNERALSVELEESEETQPGSINDLFASNLLGSLERSGKDPTRFRFRGKTLDELFQDLPESEQAALPRKDETGRQLNDVDRLVFALEQMRKGRQSAPTPRIRRLELEIDNILSDYEPRRLGDQEIDAALKRQSPTGQLRDAIQGNRRMAPRKSVFREDLTTQRAWLRNPGRADIEGVDTPVPPPPGRHPTPKPPPPNIAVKPMARERVGLAAVKVTNKSVDLSPGKKLRIGPRKVKI